MNLLPPQSLFRVFNKAKSCAIVGSASSVKQWNHGEQIDQHDLVIRFNQATTNGYEDFIGKRTDILFCNAHQAQLRAQRIGVDAKYIVCFLTPRDTLIDFEKFSSWANNIPTFFSWIPDIPYATRTSRARVLTTGTYATYFVSSLFSIEKLFVTGFNFFSSSGKDGDHYFEKGPQPYAQYHDRRNDIETFLKTLTRFPGQLQVTQEITDMARQNKVELKSENQTLGQIKNIDPRTYAEKVVTKVANMLIDLGMFLRRQQESR